MESVILYVFFTGVIYASWLFEKEEKIIFNIAVILLALANGWYITPILIGRAIKQIYKG